MKIDLHYGMDPPFGPETHETEGIGGTENFITYSAEYLAAAGHKVRVYNKIGVPLLGGDRVDWNPLKRFKPEEKRDVLLSFRTREVFSLQLPNTKLKAIALADTESYGLGDAVRAGLVDLVMFVGQWQADKISIEERLAPEQYIVTSNGVSLKRFNEMRDTQRIPGKCIHYATPERGLDALLDIWPMIQERVPHATLHLFSSFLGWRMSEDDNERMCEPVYKRLAEMTQQYQIINHKHVNAREIRQHLLESQLYLYPTRYFDETCCISALEAAAAGVPIVATKRGALIERVYNGHTGFLIPVDADGDFASGAIELLTQQHTWQRMSNNSVAMSQVYDYANLVQKWQRRWEHEIAIRG